MSWQSRHSKVILSFLYYLNDRTDSYILKGGTALSTCYGLDRISEDNYLDGTDKSIGEVIAGFCEQEGYFYRIAIDTVTEKRYMINYGNISKPLRVEASFRRKEIPRDEVTYINGISVYTIESLCAMKATACVGRDKIRDLYDLSFICNRNWDALSAVLKAFVRNAVQHKGIEQFDYIVKEQQDELIDKDKLTNDFLEMYDKLGLLYNENEQRIRETLLLKGSRHLRPAKSCATRLKKPLWKRFLPK